MTKKDYEAIAGALKAGNINHLTLISQDAQILLNALCSVFEEDNPRFSREKFLTACGIECEHSFSSFDGKCHNCGKHISED